MTKRILYVALMWAIWLAVFGVFHTIILFAPPFVELMVICALVGFLTYMLWHQSKSL